MKHDRTLRASAAAVAAPFEQKDGGAADPIAAIEKLGTAFEAFKTSHAEQIKELKEGKADPVLTERLGKIEKSLDSAQEAKNALEASIAAEKKEREDLELRLQRMGVKGDGDTAKRELELKEFNATANAAAAERKRTFVPLDDAGYDEYKAAHRKFVRYGVDELSPEERKTLSVGSDPDGGYLVTPDVSGRIVKKVYETSPIRQIAAVQAISTDALEGLEDLGEAGCGYAGEHATSGDATTAQLGKYRIDVHIIDTEPKATQQLLDDAMVDVEAWLGDKVGSKMGRFENSEFVNGAANRIRGFCGYATADDDGTGVTWGQIGRVKTGVNGDFAAANKGDKIHDLVGTLKGEYLNERALRDPPFGGDEAMRKFKDANGQYLLAAIAGPWNARCSSMGYPLVRAEDMPALAANSLEPRSPSAISPEATRSSIARDLRVLRDPYTSKPYVKFYTTKRTGGASDQLRGNQAAHASRLIGLT
jgi:HK97 family phage major capsid protein